MHFLLRAPAFCVFPCGFGTFAEIFEFLTLIQTGKIKPIPIVLFGKEFWHRVVNFDALVEEGVVSARDLDLFRFVETADEAWAIIQDFYVNIEHHCQPSPPPSRGLRVISNVLPDLGSAPYDPRRRSDRKN